MPTLQTKETGASRNAYARRKAAAHKQTSGTLSLQSVAALDSWDLWQSEEELLDNRVIVQWPPEKEYILLKKPDRVADQERIARPITQEIAEWVCKYEKESPARRSERRHEIPLRCPNVSLKRLRKKSSSGLCCVLCKVHPALYIGLILLMAFLIWALLTSMMG